MPCAYRCKGARHLGPSGCAGEQCRCRRHPAAGGRHGRSDHQHLCRERAWPKPARRGGASPFGGGEGNDHQRVEHVRSQAGCRTLPPRRQQGGVGAPDPLLGAGTCAAWRARQRHRSGAHGIGRIDGNDGLSPAQAAAIEEQERERIPLKRRGNPNDVAGDGTGDRRRWRPGTGIGAGLRGETLDVARWLAEQGHGHWAEVFAANGIAGDVLRDLTDPDLRQLGLNLGASTSASMPIARRGRTWCWRASAASHRSRAGACVSPHARARERPRSSSRANSP